MVKKIASIAALRLVLMRVAGILGLVSIAIEGAIYLLSDDNLQKWLKRCALRAPEYLTQNRNSVFETYQEQSENFNQEVLQDMFNFSDDESLNNVSKVEKISLSDTLALIEQDMDQRGLYV